MADEPELYPQTCQLEQCANDPAEVKELALAVRSKIVVHRHFDNRETALLHTRHHLDSNTAAVAF